VAPHGGTIEERLQRLEDIHAIWQLFMDYKRHLDQRDFFAYSQLFAEDGEWLGNLGQARGPAEIEALLERTLETYPDDSTRTYHLVANPTIEVDGDRATAESTWCFVTRGEQDKPVLSLVGHYEDVLVRAGDGWKFQRRVAYLDVPYEAFEV
jgi:3-phenylpropionate/cinnamic acid dioxygenase small subunit